MNEMPAVLAIDDEPVVRDILTRILRSEGFSVQAAEDSDKGLEALRDGYFDLVLLDLMLPRKSGLEVVKEIRAIDANVEIVMLTAFSSVETAVEVTKSGVFDYLVKPFKNDELLLAIKNGLDRRRLTLENQRLPKSLKPTLDGKPLQINPKALKALVDHDWPGNVRELENVIELAVVLAPASRVIRPDHLPTEILDSSHMNMTTEEILRNHLTLKEMVAEFERNLILTALERNDWNQRRTARVLRTIPTTMNQKIKRLRIKVS